MRGRASRTAARRRAGAGQSEIIETIPKRGYRLLAKVAPAAPEDQAPTPRTWQGNNSFANDANAVRGKRGWLGIAVVLVFVLGGLWLLIPSPVPPDQHAVGRMNLPLPDRPSIAVLPLKNLTGDPGKEYMADGMSEYIISSLAKIPEIVVVARHSTFVYKDNAVEVRQVAEELGVQYVLKGSLQASGERVRVTAQLIDALSGLHLWSEQYDRDLTDIFEEARAEIDKALARVNWLSLAFYEDLSHFRDPAHWQRIATALREAGLPETRG